MCRGQAGMSPPPTGLLIDPSHVIAMDATIGRIAGPT
jgi:hypothetical protein